MKLTKLTIRFTPEGWDESSETWDVEIRDEYEHMPIFVYDVHPKYDTIFRSDFVKNINKLVRHVYGISMFSAEIWCDPDKVDDYRKELKDEIRSIIEVKKILIEDMYKKSREFHEINSPSDIIL